MNPPSNYIGQEKQKTRMQALLEKSFDHPVNILLKGHYGMGKTALALFVVACIAMYAYLLPPINNLPSAHLTVIDEAHTIRNFEQFYPLMNDRSFVFVSNMSAKLPAPMRSRTYQIRLGGYTETELSQIIGVHTDLKKASTDIIAPRCKGIPRRGVKLAEEVTAIMDYKNYPESPENVVKILEEYLQVDENGLDNLDRLYLSTLESGACSKKTLSNILSVTPRELQERERFLQKSGLVKITGNGREVI